MSCPFAGGRRWLRVWVPLHQELLFMSHDLQFSFICHFCVYPVDSFTMPCGKTFDSLAQPNFRPQDWNRVVLLLRAWKRQKLICFSCSWTLPTLVSSKRREKTANFATKSDASRSNSTKRSNTSTRGRCSRWTVVGAWKTCRQLLPARRRMLLASLCSQWISRFQRPR